MQSSQTKKCTPKNYLDRLKITALSYYTHVLYLSHIGDVLRIEWSFWCNPSALSEENAPLIQVVNRPPSGLSSAHLLNEITSGIESIECVTLRWKLNQLERKNAYITIYRH